MDLNEGVSGSLIKKYKTTTGIPILNLKDNQLIIDGYIDITKTIKIHKYKKNDIFMLKVGKNIGKVFLLDNNIKIKNYVLSPNLIKLSTKKEYTKYNTYFYYYLNSLFLNNTYNKISNSHLHNFNYIFSTLSIKDVKKIKITLPKTKKLNKIIKFYKNLNAEINLLNNLLLKEKNVYNYLLNNLIEYKNLIQFNEVVSFNRGKLLTKKDYSNNQNIQVLRIKDVINNNNSNDKVYVDTIDKKHIITNNDIIMVLSGTNDNIGQLLTNFNGVITNELFKITSKSKLFLNKYIYYFLQTNKIQNQFIRMADGSFIKHSFKTLDKIKIPQISIDKQKEIINILDNQEDIISNLMKIIELKNKLFF